MAEREAVRRDKVLRGQSGLPDGVPCEHKFLVSHRMEYPVQERKALIARHRMGADTQHFEICQHIGFDAFQMQFCFPEVIRLDAKCNIFDLDEAIVSLCLLAPDDFRVLAPDAVELVAKLRGKAKRALNLIGINAILQK